MPVTKQLLGALTDAGLHELTALTATLMLRKIISTKSDSQMPATYSVVLRPEPEGGFTVRVPALPEIVTFGVDEAEAIAMAKDAIELVIQSRKELGEPIPAPDAPIYREVTVSAA